MLRMEFFQPYTGRDYSLREFRKDLRGFMEIAAIQNKPAVLYLEDHVLLQHRSILETVNSLLASGEVPGLFGSEEMERLFPNAEEVRQEFYGKSLYEAFLERVRRNLKVTLAMDWENKEFA
jgi:dynein heavy chain 2